MEPKKAPLALRIAVGVGLPVGALLLIIVCVGSGKTPPCLFYQFTGLHCVGCGAGRCFLALFHFRFYAAFRAQPLLFLSLPLLCYLALKFYLEFVFGKVILPFPKIRNRAVGITVAVVVLGYWILRNIPYPPFSYLAPTAVTAIPLF